MKRFAANQHAQQGKIRMIAALAILASALLILCLVPSKPESTANPVFERLTGQLQVRYTGMTWHFKPVYVLVNHGEEPLHRLTIRSWSEDLLPVLSVGVNGPLSIDGGRPSNSAPYMLLVGGSIWFVGPSMPPARFTVTWSDEEGLHYTQLSAGD